jgi:hypothetical protein|tara:strand:- start:74 stop:313 length:240 start_codon:yes stop_codon:yes gene_type:complete
MKPELYRMLKSLAEADKSKALLSLEIMSENAAGIGDHSTSDFWDNANEALELLASADDRLDALAKYFPEEEVSNPSTLF